MSLYEYCKVCNRSVEFGYEDRHDCEQGTKQNRSQHELETEVASLKQRLEALQAELAEQRKLNGMGAEREYILLGKIARLERVVDAARKFKQAFDRGFQNSLNALTARYEIFDALDELGGGK